MKPARLLKNHSNSEEAQDLLGMVVAFDCQQLWLSPQSSMGSDSIQMMSDK